MNQILRQKGSNSVEKDLCKLMNNSNFGYDCRNNIDNARSHLYLTNWMKHHT